MRWGIFVHNIDGDSGEGCIVGAFKSAEAADRRAEAIRRRDEQIECIVLPLVAGSTGAARVADWVMR